ncbi:hypothetical protein ADIARSV_0031 [Arcticibacter svalbardensis MN12-7]|uniref:Uncharacterized protein n=1 Tax=Arcticibacter svalbardensis MN12-7 TaxID=1150600 RepID=R9GYN7_9SPHI|nr:hypothetical protein ADIARSV_0031 [Arcticibacter svalbardensis MN12-7]
MNLNWFKYEVLSYDVQFDDGTKSKFYKSIFQILTSKYRNFTL